MIFGGNGWISFICSSRFIGVEMCIYRCEEYNKCVVPRWYINYINRWTVQGSSSTMSSHCFFNVVHCLEIVLISILYDWFLEWDVFIMNYTFSHLTDAFKRCFLYSLWAIWFLTYLMLSTFFMNYSFLTYVMLSRIHLFCT